jgi:hypothetical protein
MKLAGGCMSLAANSDYYFYATVQFFESTLLK